jgi:hypothetical protein
MPIAVEVNLRLPNISVRPADEPARVISNAEVRFIKMIDVQALPRVGDTLELSTRGGYGFGVVVKRLDWHEEKGLFVVGCQFAKRSMPLEAYESVRADPDWATKPLI